MFPVAGVVLWIALGMVAGYIAGQITHTEGSNRSMANMGVGLCAAVLGGAVVTFAQNGQAAGLRPVGGGGRGGSVRRARDLSHAPPRTERYAPLVRGRHVGRA